MSKANGKPSRTRSGSVRPERKQDTSRRRKEILDIAAACFARNGYESTTVREIADQAGILSGSLYHHFSSKDEILHQILEPRNETVLQEFRQIAASDQDALSVLKDLIRANIQHVVQGSDVQRILYNERMLFRFSGDFSYVKEFYEEMNGIFKMTLARAHAEGQIPKDINIVFAEILILRLIVSLIDPPAAMMKLSREELEEEVLKFVMRAIGATEDD